MIGPAALPTALARRIDAVCDAFEAAWHAAPRAEQRPRIEDYVCQQPGPERAALLRELLLVELDLRGDVPLLAEYQQRFPQDGAVLEDIFERPTLPATSQAAAPVRCHPTQGQEASPALCGDWPRPEEPFVLGDYDVLDCLGRGGMGTVYRARQRGANRIVALKLMRADRLEGMPLDRQVEWRTRFQTEALAAAWISHEHAVTVYEVGELDGRPFYSMRYIAGPTLAEVVRAGPLPNRQATRYLEQVARAVQQAHALGIVHRDLKPRNILVEGERAYVADFGLAKWAAEGRDVTQTGDWLGTPAYMAPEQARGPEQAAPASDLYSLGATLYDLVTGRPPFQATTPSETLHQVLHDEPIPPSRLNPSVDADLETIVLKCLQKEPSRRYASAAALAEDLGRYQAGMPIAARPIRAWERGWWWMRRRPALAALTALSGTALLLLLAGAVWHMYHMQQALELHTALRLEAQQDRDRARDEQRRAQAHETLVRHQAYAAHMRLAHQLWKIGEVSQALALLELYQEDPQLQDLRDFAWRYLWQLCHGERLGWRAHAAEVQDVSWSPDGSVVVTAGADGLVQLWDAATGRRRRALAGHVGDVRRARFAPDGRTVATGGDDGTIRLWDVVTGRERCQIRGQDGPIRDLAPAPDSRLLATAGRQGIVRLWDLSTGLEQAALSGHRDGVEAVAFSPDGRLLASGGRDFAIHLWDVELRQLHGTLIGHDKTVHALAFSPDGRTLASGCGNNVIKLWDLPTLRARATLRGHQETVQGLAFSRDGQTLASAGNDRVVRLWHTATAQPLRVLKGHTDRIWRLAYSPDGCTLATASRDRSVRLWDADCPQEYVRLSRPLEAMFLFAPDGKTLYCRDQVVDRIWSCPINSNRPAVCWPMPSIGRIFGLALAADQRTLVLACDHGSYCWDLQTQKLRCLMPRDANGLAFLAVCPEGRTLATAQEGDRVVRLWDLAAGEQRFALSGPSPVAGGLAFSPAEPLLAVGHEDGLVTLWDTRTWQRRDTLSGHQAQVSALVFSEDGRLLASGGKDRLAVLWDMATRREYLTLRGHADHIAAVAFSPDGKTVATGSHDGTVKLWSTRTGLELLSLEGHRGQVQCVRFSPDGRLLASGSKSGGDEDDVYLWLADCRTRERASLSSPE